MHGLEWSKIELRTEELWLNMDANKTLFHHENVTANMAMTPINLVTPPQQVG